MRGDSAEVTPVLFLKRSSTATQVDASVIVNIAVDNVLAAMNRLGLDTTVTNDRSATIEVRDPDGRTVQINERRANAESDH